MPPAASPANVACEPRRARTAMGRGAGDTAYARGSDADGGAHRDGPVLRQLEVAGRRRGVVSEREEEPLAPRRHGDRAPALEGDPGEEVVRRVGVDVDDLLLPAEGQGARHVLLLLEAEAQR